MVPGNYVQIGDRFINLDLVACVHFARGDEGNTCVLYFSAPAASPLGGPGLAHLTLTGVEAEQLATRFKYQWGKPPSPAVAEGM